MGADPESRNVPGLFVARISAAIFSTVSAYHCPASCPPMIQKLGTNLPRAGGLLLHPTSLPGAHGIGDLGEQAFRFLDWLADSGCQLWQILPLGPTGYGDSPYQCFSAFARNPYLISPDLLLSAGLLTSEDFRDQPVLSSARVDFGRVIPWKLTVLARAFQCFQKAPPAGMRARFEQFQSDHRPWLGDYAVFMALKESFGGGAWSAWPEPIRKREEQALTQAAERMADSILRHAFYQFLFFDQWSALRDYARRKSITIIGDIPIFVAADSADVWGHPDLFLLDEQSMPTVVAGGSPDPFSPLGPICGKPLFTCGNHASTGVARWRAPVP